jgi:hypothetical protein
MGSETGVGCRTLVRVRVGAIAAGAQVADIISRRSLRGYGAQQMPLSCSACSPSTAGPYPRVAGLGAAVEQKIKLIREPRLMPGAERQLAIALSPIIPRPQNRVLPQRVIGILLRALFCLNLPALA